MTPEKAVQKAIDEMLQENVVLPGHQNIVKRYLYMLYTIGYDSGTRSRSNQKPVMQYDKSGNLITTFESAAQAARSLKHKFPSANKSNIAACCSGRYHTVYGFVWKYKT